MKKRKHVKHNETDSEIIDAITIMSRDLVPPQTSIRWFAEIITASSQKFLLLIDSSSAWMFGAYTILRRLNRQFEEILNTVSTQTTLPLTIVTRNKAPFFLKGKSTLQTMLNSFSLKHEPCTEKEEAWLDEVVGPFEKDLNKVMAHPESMMKKLDDGFKKRYGMDLKTIGKITKAQTLSKSAEGAIISNELLDAWMQSGHKDIKKGLELARKAGRNSLQLLLVTGNAPVSADTVIGDWIYNEDGSKYALKDLIEKVFDALSEIPEEQVKNCLQILRHCWNAFPHKRLQDKSPFETGDGIWENKGGKEQMPSLSTHEDKEIDWILQNGLKFAEGQFGHQVVVIQNRKVIFRVKGEELPAANALSQYIRPDTPEKDQQKEIEKAFAWIKDKFGLPEDVTIVEFGKGNPRAGISVLHFKNGLVLYVYGFTAM